MVRIRLPPANSPSLARFLESTEDYSPEADLSKIKAKVLLINTVEDVANAPVPSGVWLELKVA